MLHKSLFCIILCTYAQILCLFMMASIKLIRFQYTFVGSFIIKFYKFKVQLPKTFDLRL